MLHRHPPPPLPPPPRPRHPQEMNKIDPADEHQVISSHHSMCIPLVVFLLLLLRFFVPYAIALQLQSSVHPLSPVRCLPTDPPVFDAYCDCPPLPLFCSIVSSAHPM